jgi:hypothetical protein
LRVGAPGPAVDCTRRLGVGASIQQALSRARTGAVVCLSAGNYGSVTLSGISPPGRVTLAPVPDARVTFTDLTITGGASSNLTIQGFHIPGGVSDDTSTPGGLVFQYDTISHNPHDYGFYFDADGNGRNGTQTGIKMLHNRIDHVGECLAVTRGIPEESAFTFSHNICGPGIGYQDTESTQPGHYIEIGGVTGVRVDHNAFIGPADPNAAAVGLHLNVFHIFDGASNVDFSNNILWHTQTIGQALLFQEGQFSNVTIDNNLDVEDPACHSRNSPCMDYSFWTADDHGLSFQDNTVVDAYWGVLLSKSQTSEDYHGGTDYTVTHNIVVGTVEGRSLSFGECSASCVFDYNVTDDRSARQAGSRHHVVGWSPRWTSTKWAPAVPYSRPPAGYYHPTGLPFDAGYTGSVGP